MYITKIVQLSSFTYYRA